jgi:uncharacterized cupin superfamily protein
MISASSLRRIPLSPVDAPQQGGCVRVSTSSIHCTKHASLQVWEYAPGRFDWCADADHSACVLSGTAKVKLSDGRNLDLEPGATLYIPRGLRGHWVVETTLRTIALDQATA